MAVFFFFISHFSFTEVSLTFEISKRANDFHRQANLFDLNFVIRKLSLDSQTRRAKSSSQVVPGP